MFHDVLHKKELFQSKKVTIFQKAENRIFPNGLTHDFCQKIQNFPFSFFGPNEPRNNVSRCSREKGNYNRVKKKTTFQKANTGNFAKGLAHDFWQKDGKFSFTFFRAK